MPNHMIIKSFIPTIKQVEGLNRTLRFIASTEAIDRDGEVLLASGWQLDKFLKNPVFQWAHDYSQPPIGKIVNAQVVNDQLVEDVEFADAETYPFADIIYRLYMGGFLNAVSVGFIPIEWQTGKKDGDPRKTYTKQEQLELSGVPVPSNPEALQSARTAKVITLKELRLVKKSIEALESKSIEADEPPPVKSPHSQGELGDEIDFLSTLLESGISDTNKDPAVELAKKIMRLTGCDKPEDIKPQESEAEKALKLFINAVDKKLGENNVH